MLQNATLSGNQHPDLLTSLMNMSLVLRLPRDMHLCRSSSNVPRLPTFLKLQQNSHVLLTLGKVPNPSRRHAKWRLSVQKRSEWRSPEGQSRQRAEEAQGARQKCVIGAATGQCKQDMHVGVFERIVRIVAADRPLSISSALNFNLRVPSGAQSKDLEGAEGRRAKKQLAEGMFRSLCGESPTPDAFASGRARAHLEGDSLKIKRAAIFFWWRRAIIFFQAHGAKLTIQKLSRFRNYDSETIAIQQLSRFRNYHDSETITIQRLSRFRNYDSETITIQKPRFRN